MSELTEPLASAEQDDPEETPLALLIAGLERARKLTVWSLLALAIGTGISWTWSQEIYHFLALPLTRELAARGEDARLVFTSLSDPFILYFSVSLFGGLLIASPVLLGQLFVILAPRLRPRRAVAIITFVLAALLLFLAGLAFCYLVLIPFAVAYLLQVGEQFESAITVREFLRFTVRLMLALGVAAQLPLVSFSAARIGLVTARTLWRWLPYAILGAFILGAWLTPPDVLSQILVAGPLLALYLLGILVAAIGQR